MKKRLVSLFLSLALCLLPLGALAGVSATPNQKLFFRTGPNTKYYAIGNMPQSTALTAIEYESGNGVTWVLVEYTRDGRRERAYTGLKRMSVNGEIPWADHLEIGTYATASCSVYGGPGIDYTMRAGLQSGDSVTLLRIDDGFMYIEFTDHTTGEPSRGWVNPDYIRDGQWYVQQYGGGSSSSAPTQTENVTYAGGTLVYVTRRSGALMYDEASADAWRMCVVPFGTVVTSYFTTSNGYLYVSYNGWEGFIDKNDLALY